MNINRRELLPYAVTSLLAAKASLDSLLAQSTSRANEIANNIPDVILSAQVEKYLVQDAKYCFVHIRQRHLSPIPGLITPESRAQVGEVQQEIYSIIEYLQKELKIKAVYGESIDATTEELIRVYIDQKRNFNSLAQMVKSELEDTIGLYEKLLNDSTRLEKIRTQRGEAGVQEVRQQYQKLKDDILKIEETYLRNTREELKLSDDLSDAVLRAQLRGLVNVRAAEDKSTYEKSGQAMIKWLQEQYQKNTASGLPKEVLDDREDALIRIISDRQGKTDEPLAVTVFGGIHDWRNNILQWNMQNLSEKMSLIVVTPASYTKYDSKNQ